LSLQARDTKGSKVGLNMKLFKLLMVGLMLVVLGGCGTSLKTPVRAPDALHSHIGESTVALVHFHVVMGKDADGDPEVKGVDFRPHCTGVWISRDEIATAGHCVESEDVADPVGQKAMYVVQREVREVMDDPAAVHMAKVVAFDKDHDVAIIKADLNGLTGHEVADLASEMPGLGEHVYSVGHPRGMYWSYAEGTVSAYRGDESSGIGEVVQVNASVWYGNSGGGVFDGGGNLVGICSRLTRVPQMNYFVHVDSLKRLLKDYHTPAEDLSKK
jgi:S1-C subfamily serine protease